MIDLIGLVADQLTQGYLETCEIHDAMVRAGLTEEEAYLTYVGAMMVYEARKAAFEAKLPSKPTIKLAAVRVGPPVSLTMETPLEPVPIAGPPEGLEPIQLDNRNDPPSLA